MSDDQGILLFMAGGVIVLVLIAVFGVLSSRRKRASGTASWTTSVDYLGEQPYIVSSDVEIGDKRQWQLFQERFAVGSTVRDVVTPSGERTLHISAVKRSLRAGWPTAKVGFTAYFAEYDGSEFPVTVAVKGNKKITVVTADREGLTATTAADETVFSSPWSSLQFSNGTDLILKNGSATVHIESAAPGRTDPLEELVIKYGTFTQLHF